MDDTEVVRAKAGDGYEDIPVHIILNGLSASASEVFLVLFRITIVQLFTAQHLLVRA
jgi:hypothetical protein